MTAALIHQRCWHHADREAVVRCPQCRRFYCRECVIEHAGRMICAACIEGSGETRAAGSGIALWTILGMAGFLLAWMVFYYLGMALDRIPSDFFE
jgi:hypothetical protein